MSVIYGKLNLNKKPIDADELYFMEKALNHWDADDKGTWHNAGIGLGHLMLYNTPESLHEKLPFYNTGSQTSITADARIDNRDELFVKLDIPKAHQPLIADSLLIVKTYEKYGESCVKHLIGDFAFAIWDEKEQKLFCARDHMGVKPFFYYRDDHFFAFASEARGLLAIKGLNAQISDDYFLKLTANWPPQRHETAYKHIRRLNCASALIIENGIVTERRYWELDTKREIVFEDKEKYLENFRAIFKEAINCRLRSNYLIGTELSGGLDSSGIACVAANLLHARSKKIASFTTFMAPKEHHENPLEREELYADEVIGFAGIDFPYKRLSIETEDDFLKQADSKLAVYGYPCVFAINWNNHFYKVAQAMNIRVMLSGHGGDQLVTDKSDNYLLQYIDDGTYGGYINAVGKKLGFRKTIKNIVLAKMPQSPPAVVKKTIEYLLVRKLKKSGRNFLTDAGFNRIKNFVCYKSYPKTVREAQKQSIIDNTFISDRMEFETLSALKYKIAPAFPMQDVRLMEYVLALPTDEKNLAGMDRLLYRNAMRGLMPNKVVNRKKHIYPLVYPYQTKWLKEQEQAKNWILDLKQNGCLPPFINYERVFNGYEWEKNGKVSFSDLFVQKRKQMEAIIRWFEKSKPVEVR